jgi:hypothetical protein
MPYYPAEDIEQLERSFAEAATALRREFGENLFLFGFIMMLNDLLERGAEDSFNEALASGMKPPSRWRIVKVT